MSAVAFELTCTGVVPAQAGTQCRTILTLVAGGDIPLVSRLRGNDVVCVEMFVD